jgi:hypothetical protein
VIVRKPNLMRRAPVEVDSHVRKRT